MDTIIFLFDKETYKEGLNRQSRFNIFKWTYEMCHNEVEEVNDFTIAMELDMSDDDTLAAFETDFNEGRNFDGDKYIMRAFNV